MCRPTRGRVGRHRTVDSEKASEEGASTVTPSMRRLWPGQEKDDFSRKKKKKMRTMLGGEGRGPRKKPREGQSGTSCVSRGDWMGGQPSPFPESLTAPGVSGGWKKASHGGPRRRMKPCGAGKGGGQGRSRCRPRREGSRHPGPGHPDMGGERLAL